MNRRNLLLYFGLIIIIGISCLFTLQVWTVYQENEIEPIKIVINKKFGSSSQNPIKKISKSFFKLDPICQFDLLLIGYSYSGIEDIILNLKENVEFKNIEQQQGIDLNFNKDKLQIGYCSNCASDPQFATRLIGKCGAEMLNIVYIVRDPITRTSMKLLKEKESANNLGKLVEETNYLKHLKFWYDHKNLKILFFEDYQRDFRSSLNFLLKFANQIKQLNVLNYIKTTKPLKINIDEINESLMMQESFLKKFRVTFGDRIRIEHALKKPNVYIKHLGGFQLELTRGDRNSIIPTNWITQSYLFKPCAMFGACHERYLMHTFEDLFDIRKNCDINYVHEDKNSDDYVIAMILTPQKKTARTALQEADKFVNYSNYTAMEYANLLSTDNKIIVQHANKLIKGTCSATQHVSKFTKAKIIIFVSYDFDKSLIKTLGSLINNNKCGSNVILKYIEYPFHPNEMPEFFLRITAHAGNCCGWHEFAKLSLFKQVKHKTILYLDIDTMKGMMHSPDHLFTCKNADFLYTNGPFATINAGVLVIKPNLNIFNEMQQVVRNFDYNSESGWSKTGAGITIGTVTNLWKREYLIKQGMTEYKIPEKLNGFGLDTFAGKEFIKTTANIFNAKSFRGIEGPQGFFTYFFVLRPYLQALEVKTEFKVGKLNPCIYNYQGWSICLYCKNHYWNNKNLSSIIDGYQGGVIAHKEFKLDANHKFSTNCYPNPW